MIEQGPVAAAWVIYTMMFGYVQVVVYRPRVLRLRVQTTCSNRIAMPCHRAAMRTISGSIFDITVILRCWQCREIDRGEIALLFQSGQARAGVLPSAGLRPPPSLPSI